MKTISLAFVAVFAAAPALAQPYGGGPGGYFAPPQRPVYGDRNNTGGAVNVIISRGPLGADTIQSNPAVAGNQARPELAYPNGSGGGGSGGNR